MAMPEGVWECPGCGDYIENWQKKCPRCGKMRDDGVNSFKTTSVKRSGTDDKHEQYILAPMNTYYGSSAAVVMQILTWILWAGGLLVSIALGKTEVSSRYGSYNEFSWTTFLVAYASFFTAGAFTFWAGEVAESIKTIAESLQRMSITKAK